MTDLEKLEKRVAELEKRLDKAEKEARNTSSAAQTALYVANLR